jgi:hypothetical protein
MGLTFLLFHTLCTNYVQILNFNKNTLSKKESRQNVQGIHISYILLPLLIIQLLSFEVVRPIYGLTSEV